MFRTFFIFALGFLSGTFVAKAVLGRKKEDAGLLDSVQSKQKRENMEKVLGLGRERSEISNDDVQNALGVSDKTAERYLQELVDQGKLVQQGETRGITYTLKQ